MDYERWAHLYDDLVARDDDVSFFVDLARAAAGARVVELMAGTGRVALRLAAAGLDVTCVDNSPGMLAVLRQKLARTGAVASVVEQDVRSLQLGARFDLVFIAFNSFEELVEDADRRTLLDGIRGHLSPRGTAVITLHNPVAAGSATSRELAGTFADSATGRTVTFTHVAARQGRVWSGEQRFAYADDGEPIASQPVRYRMTDRAEFAELVRCSGFATTALYGDYRRAAFVEDTSVEMIWLLGGAP